MDKTELDHSSTELSLAYAESVSSIVHLYLINTSPIHLTLVAELNTIDVMSTMQEGQITFAGQDLWQAWYEQCHLYPRTTSETSGAQSYQQQTTSVGIAELMDDEDDSFLFGMCDIEEFYADERWEKARLTESEQRLFVKELQSLIRNASTSAYLPPKHKVLELEYYNTIYGSY